MKKILWFLLFLFFLFPVTTSALEVKIVTPEESARLNSELTRQEVFEFFGDFHQEKVPSSYKYINLSFNDVRKWTSMYDDLQKLVYLDLIKNTQSNIYPNKTIDLYTFSKLSEKIVGFSLWDDVDVAGLRAQNATRRDLKGLSRAIESAVPNTPTELDVDLWEQSVIFQDVFKTLKQSHFDRENLDDKELFYSAISGLAEWSDDIYTTYFPPVANKSFQESLNGEFEGIGAFVDMPEPGILVIVSPIVDSPAEKAGLKWGDIITHIDGEPVTEQLSLTQAVGLIKWPSGTTVVLTIDRSWEDLEIPVVRGKIVIKDIEYEVLENDTFYIQVRNFWPNVFDEFSNSLEVLKSSSGISKVIIDVRNNPGGFLDQVSKMLGYFVPEWEPTAIVDFGEKQDVFRSEWFTDIDFSQYELVLLQNSGSASASEILVGTIKDYFPWATIIGEDSFGKGSVQNVKTYSDGSAFKYTIAKWLTGKTQTGIDGVWIPADIEVELDREQWVSGVDTQLKAALDK